MTGWVVALRTGSWDSGEGTNSVFGMVKWMGYGGPR